MDFLQEVGVNVLLWPPSSQDLNPIEHVWNVMGIRLSTLHDPPGPLVNTGSSTCLKRDATVRHQLSHFVNA